MKTAATEVVALLGGVAATGVFSLATDESQVEMFHCMWPASITGMYTKCTVYAMPL